MALMALELFINYIPNYVNIFFSFQLIICNIYIQSLFAMALMAVNCILNYVNVFYSFQLILCNIYI